MHRVHRVGSLARAFAVVSLLPAPLFAQSGSESVDLGGGTAGSAGLPTLTLEGSPIVGNPLRLQVTNAAPLEHGCVGFSTVATPVPLPFFGATVHPGFPLFGLKLFTTDEQGRSPLVLDVPSVGAHLVGASFVVQGMIDDPAAIGGSTFTNGRRLVLGLPTGGPGLVARTYDFGVEATAVAAGDLDGDGDEDAFVVDRDANELVVALADGAGGLAIGQRMPCCSLPRDVVVLDANGDGLLDVAVLCIVGFEVQVFFGDGAGAFVAGTPFGAGSSLTLLRAGDVDGDGIDDVLVLDVSNDEVRVHLGSRTGAFTFASAVPVIDSLGELELHDFDQDGAVDLAYVENDAEQFFVHFGDGDGGFGAPVGTPLGGEYQRMELGDADEDGFTDVVVGGISDAPDISILLGRPNGVFIGPFPLPPMPTPESSVDLLLDDFDGDGHLDLFALNESSWFAPGDGVNGFGSFEPAYGFYSTDRLTADVDGDGSADLVLMERTTGLAESDVTVVLSTPGVGLPRLTSFFEDRGNSQSRIAAGDIDRDGLADLVVTSLGTANLDVLLSRDGGATLETSFELDGVGARTCALADMDSDGELDIVLVASAGPELRVYPGLGGGDFGSPVSVSTTGFVDDMRIADLDGDGALDVVLNSGLAQESWVDDVTIHYGLGDGTLGAGTTLSVGNDTVDIAVADMDADGRLDLIAANNASEDIAVVYGAVGGGFEPPVVFALDFAPSAVAVADVGGDALPDLLAVSVNDPAGGFRALLNLGPAGFTQVHADVAPRAPRDIAVRDFDGDAVLDVVTSDGNGPDSGSIHLFRGLGGGVYAPAESFAPAATGAGEIAIGDFDGDAFPDVAVTYATRRIVRIHRNLLLGR